jgi:hypothetical protein
LKFIPSQFPLPMALNSVFSLIKMSDRDLKFVYLFCQTDTFLFVIETPIQMYVKKTEFNAIGSGNCEGINFNRRSFQISMFYRTFGPIYILKSSVLLHFCRSGPTVFGKSGRSQLRIKRVIDNDLIDV